ncbi:transcription termination factor NusA [Mycoplasma enhydrae]|uniref:transcription termination factor NusA n=1 Tax=Mycoplasma enhydrae TaxID=2499220 RepID=UPI0021E7D3D7|nr:transcription termination factor NusA [Mycoplasma enhydrae]MCV3733510.1 transcription termination factor NusA [Mycoplasma enhydrae]MCV3753242.1 transcription termination factor NusA [Mycoplasma enhydrae]
MSTKDTMSTLKANQIFEAIYNVSQIKKIDEDIVIDLFKSAVEQVIVSQFDPDADLEFDIDKNQKKFRVINHSKVVVLDPVTDDEIDNFCPYIEIALKEAKTLNSKVKEGDLISAEIDFERFQKKDYQKILNIFNQQIRELEKKITYDKYQSLIGTVVKARISNISKAGTLMELTDGTPAYMAPSTTNLRLLANLKPGDVLDVYIEDVKPDSKSAQVLVSSVESKLIDKLFKQEIPEVEQGFIEIVKVVRIPGERAKVAIRKTELAPFALEELGTVIGKNSQRIDTISNQLNGEKIDVVLFDENHKKFVMNAISPSRIIDIIEKEDSQEQFPSYVVVVPNFHHTLAIGKRGQNVRLASELTRSRLDIISQDQADKMGIQYTFENSNITEEEAKLKYEGKRMNLSSTTRRRSRQSNNDYQNNVFNIAEFDADLAELRQKAQQTDDILERQLYESNIDDELEKALSEIHQDFMNDGDDDYDVYSEDIKNKVNNKFNSEEDYERITSTKLKDFKKDDDLSAGLEDLDLSDLDNEDW